MKISDEVIPVLSELEFPAADQARIVKQIDRAMYMKVDKTLQAIGGQWNRKAKAHVFAAGDAQERVDLAITTGEIDMAKDIGHFVTPVKLARELVALAGVKAGDLVLEPSAGTGRIVDALLAVGAHVFAIERNDERRRGLENRATPKKGGLIVALTASDFMTYQMPEMKAFDRVVMNPPFARVGAGDHLHHVRRAFSFLRSGGVLVSVMPSSIDFRRDRRYAEFRAWCDEHGEIAYLPPGSFKESGTGVNTVTVRLERT